MFGSLFCSRCCFGAVGVNDRGHGCVARSFVSTEDGGLFRKIFPASATATANEGDVNSELPSELTLGQNYPNPFNPSTTISFALPEAGFVRRVVYDVAGREVKMVADQNFAAGQNAVTFEAADLPSGVYVYRLQTAAGTLARKMILMK